MKMNYEAPNAEVISFTSLEQLATSVELPNDMQDGLGGTFDVIKRSLDF